MSTIRTFRAASAREALAQVRAEFGIDALILGQRQVRRRRFPWHRVQIETEVTAAIGPGTERVASSRSEGPRSFIADITRFDQPPSVPQHTETDRRNAISPRDTLASESMPASESASRSADRTLQRTAATPATNPILEDPFRLYTHLIEQDVDEVTAREIVSELDDSGRRTHFNRSPLADRLLAALMRGVHCSGPIRVVPGRPRVAALVGPTGVGKTTTLAKLAANFRLRDGIRVGLITVDTYRVAAVDQLRTYANLIDVPMHIVTTPREMPQALDDLAGADLVLIDTAGRSPQDDLRIQELRAFLQAARADEVHLVLSLTAGLRHLSLAVERFRRVGPTAVLLTKLDEASGCGSILSAARQAELPLSYLTTGQDVPDDIEIADPQRIAERLLPPEVTP